MHYCLELLLLFVVSGVVIKGELLGKLMYHGNDEKMTGGATLEILHQPDSVHLAPAPGAIPSDEIASVMALSLGLSIPKDISWSGLQFGDLFNRPKAVMMVSVDGMPPGSLLKLPSSRIVNVKQVDEVSVEQLYSVSRYSSLASHVNAIFNGKASTVSMASDKKTAVFGYGGGESSKAAYWNDQLDAWQQVEGDEKSKFTKSDLLQKLQGILPAGFYYDSEKQQVKLNSKGLQMDFDMSDKVDFAIFSEIGSIQQQYEQLLANKKHVVDGVPDVYLFTISALKDLERKYGADSKEVHGALYLLELTIPKLVENFSKLYNGEILIVGVTLQSNFSPFDEHKEEINKILKSIKDNSNYVTDAFHKFIPEIHIPSHVKEAARQKLCDELQGSLAKLSGVFKFKCANHPEVRMRRSLLGENGDSGESILTGTALNLADHYDSNFAAIFNIWFWLVVVLALALYAICLSMWFMDPGKDSIIYRLTQQKVKGE